MTEKRFKATISASAFGVTTGKFSNPSVAAFFGGFFAETETDGHRQHFGYLTIVAMRDSVTMLEQYASSFDSGPERVSLQRAASSLTRQISVARRATK